MLTNLTRLAIVALFITAGLSVGGCREKASDEKASDEKASDEKASETALEVYGQLPAFQFTTQESKAFSESDLRGKVSIANFIFTRCPTVCPIFSMKMQRIAERTDPAIQLISFSVDPAYDTPERLAAYAKDFNADPARWHFLTGDPKEVRDTVEGALKIAMERQGDDQAGVPDIVHGTHFVLIDHEGSIRGYYNSDDPERIDQLVADAERLAQQTKKSP